MVQFCGLHDHRISPLLASACGTTCKPDVAALHELWTAAGATAMAKGILPDNFQWTRNCWLNRAQLYIDFSAGPIQRICKQLSGQILSYSQLINSLSRTQLFTSRLQCPVLANLTNESAANLNDLFYVPKIAEHDALTKACT
jgi:hypothetical protein